MKYFHTWRARSVPYFTQSVLTGPRFTLFMRVSFLNALLLTGTLKVLLACAVHGQELDKIHIDIELNNEPLPVAFKKIESKTGLLFAYSNTRINDYPSVSLTKGTYSVKDVLDTTLAGSPFQYWQKGNHIIIFVEDLKNAQLAEHIHPQVQFTDQFTVSGTVVEVSTQSPLPGVNIIIKGTAQGTSSDSEGKFSLRVSEDDVLILSFIGFKPVEMAVSGRSVIHVSMKTDMKALDEVVVHAGIMM